MSPSCTHILASVLIPVRLAGLVAREESQAAAASVTLYSGHSLLQAEVSRPGPRCEDPEGGAGEGPGRGTGQTWRSMQAVFEGLGTQRWESRPADEVVAQLLPHRARGFFQLCCCSSSRSQSLRRLWHRKLYIFQGDSTKSYEPR